MGWYSANKTSRTTPRSSFEGRIFAGILRNEPDLAKKAKQAEYDAAIQLRTVKQRLPVLKEIDLRADTAAFHRAIASGYTKEEARDLVYRLRKNRNVERGQKAALFAAVRRDRSVEDLAAREVA